MEQKFNFLKLFFFLSIVIILPSLFILLNAFEDKQDIRSQAGSNKMLQAQKIIFLEFDFEEDEEGDRMLKFDKPEIRNGYLTNEILGTRSLFTATSLTDTQLPIASQRFSLPEFVAIDGLDTVSGREHGEMKEVKSDEYAISLPYTENTRYVKVENVRGEIIAFFSIENAQHINNLVSPSSKSGLDYEKEIREKRDKKVKDAKEDREDSDFQKKIFDQMDKNRKKNEKNEGKNRRNLLDSIFTKVFAANGTFNVAIIGDNYGGDNIRFQSDVNGLAAGLISIEPFSSNKDKIVFYSQLANTPICQPTSGWPAISCNDSIAFQEASTIPYDKIYVLYNGNYTGYAYINGVLSYGTNSLDQNLAVKQGLFIHEMAGHSLGGLMDEYSYGVTGFSYAPNCSDSGSCPSWLAIPGLGCYSTCGYTNLYRATDNASVMNTSYFRGSLSFDSYSARVVQGKLAEYLRIVEPTATITPAEVTPSPTLTSVPFTPTLTPPPSPTPTLSITPSPTVTVILTPIPTLTQPPIINQQNIQIIEPSFTPTPTLTPTITVTATPTLTPTPTFTLTPTPTVTPTVTLTIVPSITVTACSLPNYCTSAKYCAEDLQTSGSCTGSTRVCCRPQIIEEEKKTETLSTQSALPTPTPVQRFESLPTVPIPTPTLVRLVSPTFAVSPTNVEVSITVIPTSTPIPTKYVTITSSPTASYLAIQNLQATKTIPTQVITMDILPTEEIIPSPTSVSDIIFERATPTQVPQPSAGNILQTSVSFIAALFKTLISLLTGQ